MGAELEQAQLGNQQVCQTKQRHQLRGVLGRSAVTDLRQSEALLDDAEGSTLARIRASGFRVDRVTDQPLCLNPARPQLSLRQTARSLHRLVLPCPQVSKTLLHHLGPFNSANVDTPWQRARSARYAGVNTRVPATVCSCKVRHGIQPTDFVTITSAF